MVSVELNAVVIVLIGDVKPFVECLSRFIVPIGQLDLQPALVVVRQPIEILVSDPEIDLIANIAEASLIFDPRAIETDLIGSSVLNHKPPMITLFISGDRTEDVEDRFRRADSQVEAARRMISFGIWQWLTRAVRVAS